MQLDRSEPLYIIELGAGSGKFSFFMLKALLEMKVRPSLPSMPPLQLRRDVYVAAIGAPSCMQTAFGFSRATAAIAQAIYTLRDMEVVA